MRWLEIEKKRRLEGWGATHRHRKGGEYKKLHVGVHTETEELLVIYEDVYGNVWVRPKEMFEDGRFTEIRDCTETALSETETAPDSN